MVQELQQALEQQLANLTQLSALLDQELHLISSRNAEDLINLLNEKEHTLEQIQLTDNIVAQHYQPLSASQSVPDDINEMINKSKQLVEECRYKTQVNEKAVEQGQLRLTHLRNLMLEVRAKESLTYDKSGKPKGSGRGPGISA